MRVTVIGSLILCLISIAACNRSQAVEGTAPVQKKANQVEPAQIQALIERTFHNMIFVEGGRFMMGDPGEELINKFGDQGFYFYLPCEDNRPAHKVTLDSYYLSKYEITFGEHDIFTAATGREPTAAIFMGRSQLEKSWREAARPAGVSWQGAYDYCQWLGEQTGLPFALPTEAQWEYAARSRGKLVPFATDTGYIDRGVNYPKAVDWPLPVGQFPPNPLGFHDMSGNAYEWVNDWYDPEYYSKSPGHNPQGPETGTAKVYRGGGVHNSPGGSSVVIRGESKRYSEEGPSWGFRCAINTDKPLAIGEGE